MLRGTSTTLGIGSWRESLSGLCTSCTMCLAHLYVVHAAWSEVSPALQVGMVLALWLHSYRALLLCHLLWCPLR